MVDGDGGGKLMIMISASEDGNWYENMITNLQNMLCSVSTAFLVNAMDVAVWPSVFPKLPRI